MARSVVRHEIDGRIVGLLVDGQWRDQWYDTKSTGGRFKRDTSRFRSWITPDGEAGPTGASGFKAEADRYHLYVSYACPWAHRTLTCMSPMPAPGRTAR
jgi:putative glutathione S-transferase